MTSISPASQYFGKKIFDKRPLTMTSVLTELAGAL